MTKSLHHTERHGSAQLEKSFSKLSMVAMTFAILNTWIALAGSIGIVMPSGSSVAFLYGFIFCVLCNLCLAASLGELASAWPTAGGQYHYAHALAKENWKKSISFWVGWTSIAGWLTLVTTEGFFAAQFISAGAVIGSNGTYQIKQWRTFLIFLAILTFTTLSNLYGNKILAKWNDGALYWSILAVVVISITILATSDKNDASFVFTDFNNDTGWSDGTAWILGLLQSALSLIGFDAACHMTEEMPSPSRDTPRAIVYAILVGGVTGVAFILIILFCLTDIDTVLQTSTNMPITELIHQATGSRAAAVILTVMLAICFINGTNGCVTSASRLLFAMARDKGTPFSDFFSTINPRTHVPSRTIIFCFEFNLLFGLLYLGPTVAFNAYVASTTVFLNVSYAMPVLILVLRGRGILDRETKAFSLGKYGYFANCVGIIFVGVTSVFFCFPAALPTTSSNMNYVSAVLGIFVILLTGIWLSYGKQYRGPEFSIILGGGSTQPQSIEEVVVASEGKNRSEKTSTTEE
ncbi:amino acid permease [Mollisia scopiformis]|uniref:Amino acid permease n=1 Tax=Mollisia scopiformis TaxID=149040 RepID=A0A194XRN4_MOLSC|nr:amino acid permease [Mollisia scopiformis]KUJ22950.1 amino acid permease [Mollisia scopiformis]